MSTLEELEEKREKLDKRITKAKAREKQVDRKKDTRRKILIGSIMLKLAKDNEKVADYLDKHIQELSERDRKVFDD